MRDKLRRITSDERHWFTATFARFGKKTGWNGADERTVLLVDVKLGGKVVADHLWFKCGKRFSALDLKRGDEVEFKARVSSYMKGYRGYRDDVYDKPVEKDYKLSFPTEIRKVYRDLGDGVLPLCALENVPHDEICGEGLFA